MAKKRPPKLELVDLSNNKKLNDILHKLNSDFWKPHYETFSGFYLECLFIPGEMFIPRYVHKQNVEQVVDSVGKFVRFKENTCNARMSKVFATREYPSEEKVREILLYFTTNGEDIEKTVDHFNQME